MDPNEVKKTKPVLAGNRPNYVEQGMELPTVPGRIIAPIYPENFARMVMCTAILQIIKPEILFWPISLDEVAAMKDECKDHEDWFLMDLDNSVEKAIAKTWRFFNKDIIANAAAASKMALDIGRAIDRECTTVNSVFINMLHSGYDQLVRSGAIYASCGYSGALRLKHQSDDINVVRQLVSEKVLELSAHVTPLVEQYMRSINQEFLAVENVRDAIVNAHKNGLNYVVFPDYFDIESEALRLLRNDKDVQWVVQAETGVIGPVPNRHFYVFPVFPMGDMNPLKAMARKDFIDWVEKNDGILYANPDTREGFKANSFESAINIIAALTSNDGEGCGPTK